MKVKLENIGQIECADITLDDITVLVGENNTSKSTVVRVLFALLKGIDSWKEEYIQLCHGNRKIWYRDFTLFSKEDFCKVIDGGFFDD